MMTKGGQQFKQAYSNMVLQYCGGFAGLGGGGCAKSAGAVTPQPFFEAALKGTGYCNGSTSCTAAVVKNEGANIAGAFVWSLWSDLDNGGFNFPRTMQNSPVPGSSFGASGQLSSGVADNESIGYGNYNALFATLKMADWRGLTLQSNFTWSKALGTDAVVQSSSELTPDDPFNIAENYGLQAFDRRVVETCSWSTSRPSSKVSLDSWVELLAGGPLPARLLLAAASPSKSTRPTVTASHSVLATQPPTSIRRTPFR